MGCADHCIVSSLVSPNGSHRSDGLGCRQGTGVNPEVVSMGKEHSDLRCGRCLRLARDPSFCVGTRPNHSCISLAVFGVFAMPSDRDLILQVPCVMNSRIPLGCFSWKRV